MSKINGVMNAIKNRLRMIVLCTIFLGLTTFVSVNLIYVFARIPPNISMPDTGLGMIIIGSIFGQVTLLIAISLVDKLRKAAKRMKEDKKDELEI